MANSAISHIIKSSGYEHQYPDFNVFRQAQRPR